MKPLNWATLGCGVIANELATALASKTVICIPLPTAHMKSSSICGKIPDCQGI